MNASGAISIGDIFATLTLEDSFSGRLQLAAGQLDAIGKKWTAVGNRLSEAGGAMLPLSAGIAAAGVASLVASGSFESTMTKLSTLAGVSAADIEKVKDHILALAPAVGKGPQALADAMMVVSSTIEDTSVGLTILDAAAKSSAAGMGEANDVARALTSIVNSYGAANITAARASDILTATVKTGGAEANEMAGTLGRVVPIAAQMGVKFEEVGAFLATFTKLGVDASEATTALRGVFTTMLTPTQDAEKALRDVGLSAEGLRKSIRENGLTDTLIGLLESFKGNETAAAAVFGNVRALSGIMGTAGSQAATYRDVLRQITDSAGLMDTAFDKFTKTQAFTWSSLTASVGVLAVKVGDALAPAFKAALEASQPLIEGMVRMAQAFAELPQPVQTAAIAVAVLLAAAAPLAFALSSVVKVAGVVATSIGWLTGLFVAEEVALATNTAATVANTAAKAANAGAAAAATAVQGGYSAATLASSFAMREAAIAARRSMTGLVPLAGALATTGATAASTSTGVAAMATKFSLFGTVVAGLPVILGTLATAAILGKEGIYALGNIAQSTGSMLVSFAKQAVSGVGDALMAAGNAAVTMGGQLIGATPGVSAFGDAVGGLRGKLTEAATGFKLWAEEAAKGNWTGPANALRTSMPMFADFLDMLSRTGASASLAAGQVMQYQTAEQAAAAAATHGAWVLENRAKKFAEMSKAFEAATKVQADAVVKLAQTEKDALDKLNNREVTDWAVDLMGALTKVNTVAGMTRTAQIELAETMEAAIAVYAAAGKSVPAAMVAIAAQAREMSGTVSKAQEAINDQVRGYTRLVIEHSGSTRDAQIADIKEWERTQIEAAKAAGTYSSVWYDAMKKQSAEMMKGVLIDFDAIKAGGSRAGNELRDAATKAQDTLNMMATAGSEYTAKDIAAARERRDVARAAWDEFRTNGSAALDAVGEKAEEAGQKVLSVVTATQKALQELADAKARQAVINADIRSGGKFYTLDDEGNAHAAGNTVLGKTLEGRVNPISDQMAKDRRYLEDQIAKLTKLTAEYNQAPPRSFWGPGAMEGVKAAEALVQTQLDNLKQLEYLQKLMSLTSAEVARTTTNWQPPKLPDSCGCSGGVSTGAGRAKGGVADSGMGGMLAHWTGPGKAPWEEVGVSGGMFDRDKGSPSDWGSDMRSGTGSGVGGAAAGARLAGPGGSMENNFYINGTAEEVARKVSDIFTKQMYNGRQWPSLG